MFSLFVLGFTMLKSQYLPTDPIAVAMPIHQRIAIIGTSGSGKSTLARRLSTVLGILAWGTAAARPSFHRGRRPTFLSNCWM